MTTKPTDKINYAGDVNVEEVVIISRTGQEYDIKNLVAEINIFEDIFSNCMTGNILVADGMDLINNIPLVGEELIRLRISTPTFPEGEEFYKTFKLYGLGDKAPTFTDRTQVYTLHFISQEGYIDSLVQVNGSFSGNVGDVVSNLFDRFVKIPRNTIDGVESKNETDLTILDSTKNTISFNSPSWSPFKCINYVTSRSLRTDNDGSNFVFYETNKGFVYGSIQELIDMQMKNKFLFEQYIYAPNNVSIPDNANGFKYRKPSLDRSYRLVEDFVTEEDFNLLHSNMVGHLANRVVTYDLLNKRMKVNDYDYISEWDKYKHVDKNSTISTGTPIVSTTQLRSSNSSVMVYPQHQHTFNGGKDNTNANIDKILSSRMSMFADINMRKISIIVNGRTDIECGMLVEFLLPSFKSKDTIKDSNDVLDKFYSGVYLISSIRHKITPSKHTMRLELIKDSIPKH